MVIEYRPYPKGLYNKDGVLKIVQNAVEDEAAGPDWRCRPDGQPYLMSDPSVAIPGAPMGNEAEPPAKKRGRPLGWRKPETPEGE